MRANGFHLLSRQSSKRFCFILSVLLFCFLAAGSIPSESAEDVDSGNVSSESDKSKSGDFKIFDVDCDYGTLAFKGWIERTDVGDFYKYRIQIAIVFLPGEFTHDGYTLTNRTEVADLRFCDMVATEFVEEGKPYKRLHREYHQINIRLTEFGEVGTLPDLEFMMPKSAVEAATHVGMGVTGTGNLYWPIPVELK